MWVVLSVCPACVCVDRCVGVCVCRCVPMPSLTEDRQCGLQREAGSAQPLSKQLVTLIRLLIVCMKSLYHVCAGLDLNKGRTEVEGQ